jgi:hypothetical protein
MARIKSFLEFVIVRLLVLFGFQSGNSKFKEYYWFVVKKNKWMI